VVIIAGALGRQLRADGRYRRADPVDCHRNRAAGEVRYTPARHVALHAEAVGSRGIEITGITAGGDRQTRAAARAGTARRRAAGTGGA
jgi:hypothetical protein